MQRPQDEAPQSGAIVKYQYAPDTIGFTYTRPTRFTYFSGSRAGARTSFGLSCVEFAGLVAQFAEDFSRNAGSYGRELDACVQKLARDIQDLKMKFDANQLYQTNKEIALGAKNTGHIPVILSAITAAASYEKAARMVDEDDVMAYFDIMPGAAAQAREFLVKQDMMKVLVAFREELQGLRYRSHDSGNFLMACNTLIKEVDDRIFSANTRALPRDCEEFDLFEPFVTRVFELVRQFDDKYFVVNDFGVNELKTSLLVHIRNLENVVRDSRADYACYLAQEAFSKFLYEQLQFFFKKYLNLDAKTEEMELTDEQDAMLQDALPLLAYLNSEHNPFGRTGLFGKLVSNAFHNEALEAYKSHERKVECRFDFLPPLFRTRFASDRRASAMEYSGDQMTTLLFGPQEPEKKQTGGVSGFFAGLFGEASAGGRDQRRSESQQRRELLALPMPPQYQQFLAIEWNPKQSGAPKPSGPTTKKK
jgi:hypothetical protein